MKTQLLSLFVTLVATTTLWAQNNVITYTATEKLRETTSTYSSELHTNAFNVAIISHDFSNGIGTITFADEITTIGSYAFFISSKLTSITIPNSVTTIGNSAFHDCSRLTSVTIGNSVTTIGNMAFANCALTSLTIPNSVITIGNSAFLDCSSLTSVTIGNSVTTIGNKAFYGCSSLPVEDNLRYADTYLVQVVDKTPSSHTIKDGTKWIGSRAFEDCTGLTSITIPSSVISIGEEAFRCCGLTSITIPNSVITIGEKVFEYCDYLTSVTIGKSVTTIGDYAFYGCTSLASIDIPNSVETIGEDAFGGCISLQTLIFEGNVCQDSINEYAFDGVGEETPASLFLPTNWTGTKPDKDGYWYGGYFKLSAAALPMIGDRKQTTKYKKVINNGQILLERNNATYTPIGQKVK